MFDHSPEKVRSQDDFSNHGHGHGHGLDNGSGHDQDNMFQQYGFVDSSWGRFDMNPPPPPMVDHSAATLEHDQFDNTMAMSGMEWTPTVSDDPGPSHFHDLGQGHDLGHVAHSEHMQDGVELDDLSGLQSDGNGGGVGRLVAHFENKSFSQSASTRPNHQHQPQSNMATSPPTSSHFGSFNGAQGVVHLDSPITAPSPATPSYFGSYSSNNQGHLASPATTPADTAYGSFGAQSRVTSPHSTSPPPVQFGSFQDVLRVGSPGTGPSSGTFGSLDNFMANNRNHITSSPMVSTPAVSTPVPGGTPGFAIWRPPPSTTPAAGPSQVSDPATTPGGYFKPPVPPKPATNSAGGQFILEFHPTPKAKGKAPAKPPKPRAPLPPKPEITPTPTPVDIKQEPLTPQLIPTAAPSTMPAPSPAPQRRSSSISLRPQTGTRPSREQVPAEAWELYKSTIRKLYLEERKPLKEVMSVMEEKHGFQATPKMYKTRFSQWGFVKNNTEDEVKRLLSMKFQRDAEGKVSEFVRNGRVVNLGTYLKRKGVTEYDLVDFEQPADLPSHIRCRTPTPPLTPEYLRSPDLLRAQELVITNTRKAFLACRQFEVETDTHVGWPSTMVWGAHSSELLLEANFYFEARDADQGGHFLMRAFKDLEVDLKKLTPQGINEVLLGMVHRDPGMMTALCKYVAAFSSTNFDRAQPLRQIYTCLYEVQQKHGASTLSDLLWSSMPTIAEELEAIYGRRHPYVARTWADLALFYNHVSPDRLERLAADLRILLRQAEQRHGVTSVDVLALRYNIAQLQFAAGRHSDTTKQTAVDLWNILKRANFMHQMRGPRANAYCYHSPLKVDPWTKRCRRRYDCLTQLMEDHVGVKVTPYFEEDFHTAEHVLEAQDAWQAALDQGATSKWGFI